MSVSDPYSALRDQLNEVDAKYADALGQIEELKEEIDTLREGLTKIAASILLSSCGFCRRTSLAMKDLLVLYKGGV